MSKKKKKEKDVEKKIKKAVKTSAKALAAAGKAAVAKPKPPKPAKKKAAKITNEDIALRAYFIAERRQASGEHGDEHGDWVEAERQLRAEAGKK